MQNRENEALLVRFYRSFLKPLSLTQSLKCFATYSTIVNFVSPLSYRPNQLK